jgi:hypothetical protein
MATKSFIRLTPGQLVFRPSVKNIKLFFFITVDAAKKAKAFVRDNFFFKKAL